MLPTSSIEAAAEIIWSNWQSGTVIEALPSGQRPESRAEGYAVQAALERNSARSLFGWKIAATSIAGQQHIGVDGPLGGRLLAEKVFLDGATVPFGHNRMAVAEPEFAFLFGRDLQPRDEPYTVEEVLAAVVTLHPAIELPDSRFADFAKVGAAQLIADNACAHLFVLGPATTADWRGIDLARHAVKASVVGRYDRDGIGSNVLGDPRVALTWLVNEVTGSLGLAVRKGQVVTTGTCAVPLEIVAGDKVVMDFGLLGRVSVQLSDR